MTIEQQIEHYPSLAPFFSYVNSSRLLKGSRANMDILYRKYGDPYLAFAEEMLVALKKLGLNPTKLYEIYIYDYISHLVKFQKTGEYNNGSFDEIKAKIYDNEKLMQETYLPGVFMAYGFTTLLHEKYKLFEKVFLPKLHAGMRGVEIGFGDGFFLWVILNAVSGIKVHGLDISPSAIEFTTKLLTTSNIGAERYSLALGDIGQQVAIEDSSQDWCILAEVIEHVADPHFTLSEISRFMKPGGLLFVTTVKDSNHMDHITNFESSQAVKDLLAMHGFKVDDDMQYVVRDDFKNMNDASVGLAYSCRRI